MPSPDSGPPGLVFNVFNTLLSLSRKAPIWNNYASSQSVSVPRGPPCSRETGMCTEWCFDLATETLPAQAPWRATGERRAGYPPEGRSERFREIPLTRLLEKLPPLYPLHRDPEGATMPQPCIRVRCTTRGIQCYSSYWQDATLFSSSYLSQAEEIGDCSKVHYRK